MTRRQLWLWLPAMAALVGCETVDGESPVLEPPPPQVVIEDDPDEVWRGYASSADIERLERLDEAWTAGLAAARAADFVTAVDNEGALLDPDAGLDRPAPTPGSYKCRLVKLGAAKAADPEFIAYNPFFCFVQVDETATDGRFTIVKQTGSQRPTGRLWDAGDRYVFLGSLALGNEREPLAYGEDPSRDMAGVWERIGNFRWRLVIPYPRTGGIVDVFELTPVADQPE
ncbi:DUF4893 domain-containing protein [Sphingomicrobium marinum]|uniref:DUF4893 domain-containing protein n=1 Tax=Sphingomicrobium marinum TaxID=1227950 RepID=UPI00223EFA56|nr:DUF4893 domain-containing protein [Sphingomicrobium marinum]